MTKIREIAKKRPIRFLVTIIWFLACTALCIWLATLTRDATCLSSYVLMIFPIGHLLAFSDKLSLKDYLHISFHYGVLLSATIGMYSMVSDNETACLIIAGLILFLSIILGFIRAFFIK